jgi:methylthioribose-1-phosphate isomerase
MRVDGRSYRTIFVADEAGAVAVIDQTLLPFRFELRQLHTMRDAAVAIRDMIVRGAPLIGVTAAYGVALAMREDAGDGSLEAAIETLAAARPTAVNLSWGVERVLARVQQTMSIDEARQAALAEAQRIAKTGQIFPT